MKQRWGIQGANYKFIFFHIKTLRITLTQVASGSSKAGKLLRTCDLFKNQKK